MLMKAEVRLNDDRAEEVRASERHLYCYTEVEGSVCWFERVTFIEGVSATLGPFNERGLPSSLSGILLFAHFSALVDTVSCACKYK